ncbi:MAG: nucleotidyltransferase domain-containing protein [Oscillospiraceae bacterium]|nr:nucleotidyltransferase domain-containing protein [Oscillospiraceae bacterium]
MCDQTQLNKITDDVVENVRNVLEDKLYSIILYGSYARGDYDSESDVDIMVLADIDNNELPRYRDAICNISSDISLENNITISIFLKNWKFFNDNVHILPFYKNVADEGVTVYGR